MPLAIGRVEGESVYLRQPDGTVMTVTVVRIQGNKVVLGVAAPREVAISRSRPAADPAPGEVPGGCCDDRR